MPQLFLLGQDSDLDIFKNAQPAEHINDLEGSADAQMADAVRRTAADLFALENDLPLVRLDLTGDQIEECGFT